MRENPPAAAMGAVYRERTGFHKIMAHSLVSHCIFFCIRLRSQRTVVGTRFGLKCYLYSVGRTSFFLDCLQQRSCILVTSCSNTSSKNTLSDTLLDTCAPSLRNKQCHTIAPTSNELLKFELVRRQEVLASICRCLVLCPT